MKTIRVAIPDASNVVGQVDGFKPYNGGEELRRAVAALAGSSTAQDREVEPQVLECFPSNVCLKTRLHLLDRKKGTRALFKHEQCCH